MGLAWKEIQKTLDTAKRLHRFDFIECFTTTFLRAHSWLNRVEKKITSKSAPKGVWTKDLINFIPMYCYHWDCGLRQVQVRQA